MERFLPDAFIFAIILTFFVLICASILTPSGPIEVLGFWGDGLWNLVKFSMEMVLVLVSGFTLAKTDLVKSLLNRLARRVTTQSGAVLLSTIVSSCACYLNWGFGLIVAGLFAVELAKRIRDINMGLLLASSYSGFMLWHGGFSGSIPLKLTSPSIEIQKIIGVDSISLSDTIFTNFNMIILLCNFATIIGINYYLSRKVSTKSTVANNFVKNEEYPVIEINTPAQKLENSKLITGILSLMALVYIVNYIMAGKGINLGLISFVFLFLGLALHKTPKRFLYYFTDSVSQSSGIILQFPLYAGIMAMMKMSGLGELLSQFFINMSTENTFLVYTYWSAGLVNFFVPSGGGQWALQAPFILPAANELGVSLSKSAMAIAWGDAWTNMVQPFWAIPLLSIAKVKLKDIMGCCVIIFFATGLVTSILFAII